MTLQSLTEQRIMLGQQIDDSSDSVAAALSKGDYQEVLRSPAARAVFGSDHESAGSLAGIVQGPTPFDSEFAAADISGYVTSLATRYVAENGPEAWQQITWVAAACLNAFQQTNWTGPELDLDPVALFPGDLGTRLVESFIATQIIELPEDADRHEIGRREHMGGRVYLGAKLSDQRRRFDADVLRLLERDGEEAYTLTPRPLFLHLARLLLVEVPRDRLDERDQAAPTAQWWAARVLRVQQTLLEYPAQTLLTEVLGHYAAAARSLPGSPVQAKYAAGLAAADAGSAMDAGLDEDPLAMVRDRAAAAEKAPVTQSDQLGADARAWDGLDDSAREVWARYLLEIAVTFAQHRMAGETREHLALAQAASGLQWRMTGVKGRRTRFQTFDVTQLVVDAASRRALGGSESELVPESMALNDDTLLEHIALTGEAPAAAPLTAIDRCILLALCQNVENENPAHGLTSEQMRPFVARVLDRASNWTVYTTGLLQRSRLEAAKTRTAERSVLQLQALVDQIARPQPGELEAGAAERLAYLPVVVLPSQWDLEAELARRFVSLGVIRSALDIFERLQQWDDVIAAFVLLGQEEVAERIVRAKLEETPDRPKLWCVLGDLKSEPAHWRHAWAVSGERYARAMRSLGAHHYAKQEYPLSAECYRRALALNPLFEKSWYILGCTSLQTQDWASAATAFQRVVSLDHERGDAWNNLASACLQLNDDKHRERAWYALREAARCMFDSWKVWENFMRVSLGLKQYASAIHAMGRIVTLRAELDGARCVDLEALRSIISALTRGGLVEGLAPADAQRREQQYARYVEHLLVEQIEARITRSAPLWRTMAEFWSWRSDFAHCLDCHVKAHRSLAQVAELAYEKELFHEAVDSAIELVSAYENLGDRVQTVKLSSDDGEQEGERKAAAVEQPVCADWRHQAKMALRSLMGKGKESFEGSEDYARLTEALAELRQA
ncbi:hypothetical protein LPJ53_006077 [Coemansia erecta]|uniref:TPR-like protein n=1 Tax=Coemansia erecta TaxID=147472 RepID=A0A9W7XTJ7_9FUNG|nr:hypothetical protein LPJ53_006077 [Coemansia erecta]